MSGPEHLALEATLSLGSATSTQVTARLRSSDISALAGADYHAINRLVSFAPNTTEQRIDIPLINDLMDEDRETFTIELHDKSDEQRLPLDYIHVTILDEDGVTMTVRNARANESKREILHFIDLSEGVTWPIRFRAKTVDGTATAPEDYSPRDRSGTHVPDLEPGEILTGVYRMHPIVDDAVDEPDETYTLRITGLAGVRRATREGTMTIIDNDPTSTNILLTAEPPRVSEGDGGTDVKVTATLDASARTRDTTVTVSVSASGNAGAVDFVEVGNFTITIAAGDTSGVGTFTLEPVDDRVDELDETVTVSGNADLPVTADMIELVDDDDSSEAVILSASPGRISERDGARTIAVTATLDASARTADTTVSVSVTDSGRRDAVDYVATETGFEITIAAGATAGTRAFTVTPEDDDVDERDERLHIDGTSDLSVTPTSVTLTDDDQTSTEIVLSAVPATVTEGAGTTPVEVTATLDAGARVEETTVTVSVAGSGDPDTVDFRAVPDFVMSIAAGATSGRGSFNLVPVDDDVQEVAETLSVSGSADLPVSATSVTITDNDVASDSIVLSVSPPVVSEGAGAVTVRVTSSLNGAVREVQSVVTVSVAGSGDPLAVDFRPVADFTVAVAAGATSGTGTFTLEPLDDATVEMDETLTVTGQSDLPVESTTVRLADDDEPSTRILLSAHPDRVSEGDGPTPVTVTATLDRALRQQATSIAVSVSGSGDGGAADFAAVPDFAITIAAYEASGMGTFTLEPEDDTTVETDEELTIAGMSDLSVTPATVTLADDDEVSTRILLFLAVDPPRASEGDGEIRVTVTAALDKGGRAENTRITVSVAGRGDPDAVDFLPVPDFEIVIPGGASDGTATFTITPVDDLVVEADELLTVSGESDLPVTPATMELLDDDEMPERVLLSVDPAWVSEGEGPVTVAVTASLDRGLRQEATTVAVSVEGSGDPDVVDFASIPDFRITIEANAPNGTGTFVITPEDDDEDEANETLTLTGESDLPVSPTSMVLADDDEMAIRVLSIADAEADESAGEVRFEVTLDGPSRSEVTVGYATADPAMSVDAVAAAGGDYEISAGTLTFTPGDVTGTIQVAVVDDDLDEPDEVFAVVLSDVQGAATLGTVSAVGTIRDDDEPPALTVEDAAGNEDVGALEFAVTLSAPSGVEVSAAYATADDSATAGSDYTAAAGTVVFLPGEVSQTIRVAILDDEVHEADQETFELSLSALVNATAAQASATGTIRDDDLAPPSIVGQLPPAMLCVGGAAYEVDLAGHFRGDELRYSAVSSAPEVATVAVHGSRLTVVAVAEGEASVTVTTANDSGSVESSLGVRVVTDAAELEAVDWVLASIARGFLSSVTGTVQARFTERPAPQTQGDAPAAPHGRASEVADLGRVTGIRRSGPPTHRSRSLEWNPLIGSRIAGTHRFNAQNQIPRGSSVPVSFSLDSGQSGSTGPSWSVWGRGDRQSFDSGSGRSSHDGGLETVQLGADVRVGDWLAGVSVARSRAEADYRFMRSAEACGGTGMGEGMVDAQFTSVHPYAGRQVGNGWAWAALGAGHGDVSVERCATGLRRDTDLSMRLAAAGGRHPFAGGRVVEVSVVEEVGVLAATTGDVLGPLGDRSVTVGQARLGLEAAGIVPQGCECSLSSFVRGFARGDWGDGATGAGLELAAGLRFRNLPRRLAIDAEIRTLVAHSAEHAAELSANAGLSLLPRTDGTGWQGALTWRRGATSGVDALVNRSATRTLWSGRSSEAKPNGISASRLGYGIALRRGMATPFMEFDVGRSDVGTRFGVLHQFGDHVRGLEVQWRIGRRLGIGNEISLRAAGRF